MFLLVLFWGASAIPLTLLVLGWGGPRRHAAAWRLLGYWGLGTGVLAAGVLAFSAVPGAQSFDMDTLLKAGLSPRIQIAVSLVMIVAAATRLPLFPLHGWMRDVLAEAPPGVVVVVAGGGSRPGAVLFLRPGVAGGPAPGHFFFPRPAGPPPPPPPVCGPG